MPKKIILSSPDIRRVLTRIAHEIIERNKSTQHLILVGVHTRGVPLARRLATNIENLSQIKIPVGALDISPHRDDLSALNLPPIVHHTDIPVAIDGKTLVLVDDVLYTGRSVRAAMDALIELGRPQSIQLAVLIDRGHREMPIRPDYVGKNIPSSKHEEIKVKLLESDGIDEVAVVNVAKTEPLRNELENGGYFERSYYGTRK